MVHWETMPAYKRLYKQGCTLFASYAMIRSSTFPTKASGKPRKYGEKLTLETLTDAHRKSETVEKGIQTCIYQTQVWHKNFPEL
jgi:hypothetical protein